MTYTELSSRVALATALGFALTVGIATRAAAADDVRLVEAAKQNDPFVIRALLDEGLDVNSRHPDGSTALLWATYYDDPDTAELLIAASADVNAANDYGESPAVARLPEPERRARRHAPRRGR